MPARQPMGWRCAPRCPNARPNPRPTHLILRLVLNGAPFAASTLLPSPCGEGGRAEAIAERGRVGHVTHQHPTRFALGFPPREPPSPQVGGIASSPHAWCASLAQLSLKTCIIVPGLLIRRPVAGLAAALDPEGRGDGAPKGAEPSSTPCGVASLAIGTLAPRRSIAAFSRGASERLVHAHPGPRLRTGENSGRPAELPAHGP